MEREARENAAMVYWDLELSWGTFVRSFHRLVLGLGESSFSARGGGEKQKTRRAWFSSSTGARSIVFLVTSAGASFEQDRM